MRYSLVTPELVKELESGGETEHRLFLEPHPEFKGYWGISAFDGGWIFDFHDLVGPYKAIGPTQLDAFLSRAESLSYEVIFFEDPLTALDRGLDKPPSYEFHSDLEGSVRGLLPFQLEGFNHLKDLDAGIALWSTGVGKTNLAAAILRHHYDQGNFDTAFIVVKAHNKVNTQRRLKAFADLDSVVIDGTPSKREKQWSNVRESKNNITVLNYEKFRTDKDAILELCEDRRILIVWDEAPTRLKNRKTMLYKAICSCLYTTRPPVVKAEKQRPSELRQLVLTATPIENSPEDFFNVCRLLDPTIYGTVSDFYDEYVKSFNYFSHAPEKWWNLKKMGMKVDHMLHRVDKTDPEIAAQFPKVMEIPLTIDWTGPHRYNYDKAADLIRSSASELQQGDLFSLIGILQMMCDAPSMVKDSAELFDAYTSSLETKPGRQRGSETAWKLVEEMSQYAFSDDGHPKLEALRELLVDEFPDEKVLLFTAYNDAIMPVLKRHLEDWGVSYVRYQGDQEAQDLFKEDPDVQVFLSSDMGSDSLSLEEASVVIHFDFPWKWSTFVQRQNRAHRVVSSHETVRYYTLMMENSIEDRKWQVIQKKKGFQEEIFDGADAGERVSLDDLLYILGVEDR